MITDGTSNTIAFGEGLVGDFGWSEEMLRNTIDKVAGANKARYYNVRMAYKPVLAALTACSAKAEQYQLSPPSKSQDEDNRGNNWIIGNSGVTLFNTVVPPNSQKYPMGHLQRQQFDLGRKRSVRQRHQQPLRRLQLPVRRRQRPLPQKLDQHEDLLDPRHQGRR